MAAVVTVLLTLHGLNPASTGLSILKEDGGRVLTEAGDFLSLDTTLSNLLKEDGDHLLKEDSGFIVLDEILTSALLKEDNDNLLTEDDFLLLLDQNESGLGSVGEPMGLLIALTKA